MGKMKIGVICPSEIAFRRFMPALSKCKECDFAGVAVASAKEWGAGYSDDIAEDEIKKAEQFVNKYNGGIFKSYLELITSDIDAVYIPLPPGLHYKWGIEALKNGKHLFVEKPATTCLSDTLNMINLARKYDLALHENYMFQYHSQISSIVDLIKQGKIGSIRLIRINFGFPLRSVGDFRYKKSMGGGALLDCGGYAIKLADILLGNSAKVVSSRLNYTSEFDVDLYGSAVMENDEGLVANIAFGMDNAYKCEIELWGSRGTIYTNRVMTAPADYSPIVEYKDGNNPTKILNLPSDDAFQKSIERFVLCVNDVEVRNEEYRAINRQADLVQQFWDKRRA